jgi:hypothetical protein
MRYRVVGGDSPFLPIFFLDGFSGVWEWKLVPLPGLPNGRTIAADESCWRVKGPELKAPRQGQCRDPL